MCHTHARTHSNTAIKEILVCVYKRLYLFIDFCNCCLIIFYLVIILRRNSAFVHLWKCQHSNTYLHRHTPPTATTTHICTCNIVLLYLLCGFSIEKQCQTQEKKFKKKILKLLLWYPFFLLLPVINTKGNHYKILWIFIEMLIIFYYVFQKQCQQCRCFSFFFFFIVFFLWFNQVKNKIVDFSFTIHIHNCLNRWLIDR